MEKSLLIFNRYADKGKHKNSYGKIMDAIKLADIPVEATISQYSGHSIELAERGVKDGFEKIIAVGGDGSVNEVANGIIRAQQKGYGNAALGIIPNGRGNDFGYAVKIPQDLNGSIQILKNDRRLTIDVGKVQWGENERYFLNGGGMGFDSAINFYASKSRFAGFASYGIGLVKAVFRDFRQEQALITAPGFAFNEPVLFVAFLNGKREGGGFILAPDFDIQDGLLNVCIVGRGSSLPKLLPLIPRFLSGELDHPEIVTVKTPRLEVNIKGQGFIGQVDGECIFTEETNLVAEIAAEKIELITDFKMRESHG